MSGIDYGRGHSSGRGGKARSLRTAFIRRALAAGSMSMNPSGVGVTSQQLAFTARARGKRRALEFPAWKTVAVSALMDQRCN